MSRINTNVSSLIAQRVLTNQNVGLVKSLERLSTGLRINRGSDDPAGLVASENLRSEQRAINAAIGNSQRAEQVVNVAEGGLQEINNLLLELQALIGSSANDAGVSDEEKEANQLQIDSILQTIDRLAGSTSFQGIKLLNGNFDYTTSGVSATLLDDVTINAAKIPDATIAKQLKLWGSRQQKFFRALTILSSKPGAIAKVLHNAVNMDKRSKSGLGNAMRNLESFIFQLSLL